MCVNITQNRGILYDSWHKNDIDLHVNVVFRCVRLSCVSWHVALSMPKASFIYIGEYVKVVTLDLENILF